ncbi:hypothetical protein GCM10009557_00460 [Virgisporangium ochraceum]|uniref:Prepilin type IV endopeptidase peptidase domain-containing protein n=1 Tax=Virgisporangium ochraceum TaxID=65505 RepID=A0A8J4A4I7_9ACTN|nr:A24 family peptidase [Virgisporangium ochraceum]GIJ74078.1 hypothetical protein Voc01_089950 [Virgisporangium ochraceum]
MTIADAGIFAAALALVTGPWLRGLIFAHSVAYRQPLRRRCPACGAIAVGARAGLLIAAPLDGRCPLCRSPLGPTPGVVELTCAAVLVGIAVAAPSGWVLAAWTWTALLAVALAFVDVAVMRLPDTLTVTACVGSLGLLGIAAIATGSAFHLGRAIVGGVGLGALYLVPILWSAMGMGRGDGMLAVVVGMNVGWLGLDALVTSTLATAAIAAACTLTMLASGRVRRGDHVAVGPFILLGALAAIHWHST